MCHSPGDLEEFAQSPEEDALSGAEWKRLDEHSSDSRKVVPCSLRKALQGPASDTEHRYCQALLPSPPEAYVDGQHPNSVSPLSHFLFYFSLPTFSPLDHSVIPNIPFNLQASLMSSSKQCFKELWSKVKKVRHMFSHF